MKQTVWALVVCLLLATLAGCAPTTQLPQPPELAIVEPSEAPGAGLAPQPTAALQPTIPQVTPTPQPTEAPPMRIHSAGIVEGVMGDAFGAKGTQKDGGVPTRSLPVAVEHPPEGTAYLALTMIDPDGGDWVHWLAANIPAGDIAENASVEWDGTVVQGRNDFQKNGYGGPTPPSGTHGYVVSVYALSEALELQPGFGLKDLLAAMEGKVLAEAEMSGDYSKK